MDGFWWKDDAKILLVAENAVTDIYEKGFFRPDLHLIQARYLSDHIFETTGVQHVVDFPGSRNIRVYYPLDDGCMIYYKEKWQINKGNELMIKCCLEFWRDYHEQERD